MGPRQRQGRGRSKTHALPMILLSFLGFLLIAGVAFGIGMIGNVNRWLSDLPDYTDANAYLVSEPTDIVDCNGNTIASFYTQNRKSITKDQVSPYVLQGTVDVEDERFYEHGGIDLWGIARASVATLTGGHEGASTITQQLVRNTILQEEQFDSTIERKVREAYIAIKMEDMYSKDEILMMYLNTIYLGYNSYGVQTAADRYFGKDVSQLDLAECAVLAGLTNNPSIYDVYNHSDKVKSRQETILSQMLDQNMITEDEYNAAVSEQLNYRPYEEYQKDVKSTYSYFTDEVIKDVINDLKEQKGYSELVAENMVYSGGLKIHATIDTKVQDALDSVYTDDSAFPNTEKYGEVPESAMVITDKQGDIVAIAGGRGQKTLSRSFSFATDARRQPGSSFKPLASYGPAMDAGIIVPSTTIYDRAFSEGEDGMPWPMNDGKYPTGRSLTIKEGITRSLNTVSVQVLNALTPQASYDFLTSQLDIKLVGNRTNEDGTVQSDIALAPLALGALTDGVTVREMAGAYSTFIDDGVFGGTRTYTKVLDNEGNTVLENTPYTDKGFTNVHTVYDMLDCLQNVTAHGTAYGIQIDGVETAGKTGTTSSNTDIWFCGVTPEYSAAVWVGYEHNYRLDGLYGRNAAEIWLKVMEKVHAGDSGLVFDSHPQDFVEETYCMDTGLLASGACREAGRAATGRFWKDKVPTQTCSHENIEEKYDFETSGMDDYYDEYDDEESDDSSNTDSSTDSTDNGDSSYENGDSDDSSGGDDGGDDGSSGGDDGGNIAPAPDPEPAPDPAEEDPES